MKKQVLFSPDKEQTVNIADINSDYFGLLHTTGVKRFIIQTMSCAYVCDSKKLTQRFLNRGFNLDKTLKDIHESGNFKIYEFINSVQLMKWFHSDS